MNQVKAVLSQTKTLIQNLGLKKVGFATAAFAFVAIAAVFALTPRAADPRLSAQGEVVCANAPSVPTLNPFPTSFDAGQVPCHDFPSVLAVYNGQRTQQVSASDGQTFDVWVYIHNGTAEGNGYARNINAVITVNDNVEPNHVIGATVTSSNAGTVTGAINITTASDERLQIVSGSQHFEDWYGNYDSNAGSLSLNTQNGEPTVTAHLNDLNGCFQYSKFIVFTVKVMKASVTPVDYTFTINKNEFCVGEGTQYTITSSPALAGKQILWSSFFNGQSTGEVDANYGLYLNNQGYWSQTGTAWRADQIGSWRKEANIDGVRKSVNFIVKTCGGVTGQNTLTAQAGGQIGSQCLRTGTVDWTNSSDVTDAEITVQDLTDNSQVQILARHVNGHADTPWLTPGHTYQYIMYNTTGGQHTELARKQLVVPDLSCGGTPVDYTFTINKNEFCVGEGTQYTITSSPALAGKQILWSSFFNGQSTGEVDANYGLYLNSQGYWSQTGTAWRADQIGSWRKEANIDGVRKSVNFVVKDCTPVVPTLVCQTLTPNVNTNQTAMFSATGGTGVYSWTATGGNPASGSGSSFNTSYATSGTKIVRVSSGSQAVDCPAVVVNQVQPNDVQCDIVGSSVVDINQPVTFRASGGNGTFAFNAPEGNPSTQSSSTQTDFTTRYATSGSKVVKVISGSKFTYCPVVTVRPQVTQLTCAAVANPVTLGNTVYFTASGGSGIYSWTAPSGNPANGSGSMFGTVYGTTGLKIVSVQSGGQTASCSVQINPGTPVCEINKNADLTRDALVKNSDGTYRTTLYYAFSGSNPVKLTYLDPEDGQEHILVSSATVSGTRNVTGIKPNLTYEFRLYDVSICGGLLDTLIVRQDEQTQCVSNSNYALNLGVPVKNNDTYSLAVSWVSTGNHQIKIAQGSSTNVITTGNNNGSYTVANLAPGSTHSFYMIDAECNTVLASAVAYIPAAPGNQGNYNNCVNNSCNTTNTTTNNTTNTTTTNNTNNYYYYYIQNGNTVPYNEYRQLSISKTVRNNYGSFQESVSANPNDTVEFQIVVRNIGNQPINNVRVTDYLPSGLSWVSGSFTGNSDYYIGTLYANDSRTLTYQARVNSSSGMSIRNTASATGDSVSQVQDDAWVFVSGGSVYGGNVSLTYSKRAFNDTRNTDATAVVASREDYITYTLTVTNNGNTPATNFVITDDLSQVLPYADLSDNGGGQLSGNTLSFPGLTIPAGGSVSKSFRVRIKYSLSTGITYLMSNTYGNTVSIQVNQPAQQQVLGAFVAPKTGVDSLALVFGGLSSAGFALFRRRDLVAKTFRVLFG